MPVGRMAMFELGKDAFGPITPMTRATVEEIQRAVGSSIRVKNVDRHGPEVHAYLGTELLFYVIPNQDGSVFNIHAVSPKITIVEHPSWVIGSPFTGSSALTKCECWGEHPMCFANGDHVALGFVVDCDKLDTPVERRSLEGVPIQRAVWNPHPFGAAVDASTPPATAKAPKSLKDIFGGDP